MDLVLNQSSISADFASKTTLFKASMYHHLFKTISERKCQFQFSVARRIQARISDAAKSYTTKWRCFTISTHFVNFRKTIQGCVTIKQNCYEKLQYVAVIERD
jgi:hypothetical protein